MVSRSLTEVFVLMRNNAIHSKQLFAEHSESERVRLVRSGADADGDVEAGERVPAPPPWTDSLEEAHYIITRLKNKLSELQTTQSNLLARPGLDDAGHAAAARSAADIARLFGHAHTHLAAIRAQVRHGSKSEQKLTTNVVLALVTSLQDLSVTFRTAQSHYIKSLTSREERSNAYFDLPNFEELSLDDKDHSLLPGLSNTQTDFLFSLPSTSQDDDLDQQFQKQAMSQKQLLLLEEENTRMVAEREEEVNKIVRSLADLNDIFKDLGNMVHEQGTILDRIDYNIEQTQVQVAEGFKQLQKADRYQRSNRKMHCILVLAVMIIILVMLLIIVKS